MSCPLHLSSSPFFPTAISLQATLYLGYHWHLCRHLLPSGELHVEQEECYRTGCCSLSPPSHPHSPGSGPQAGGQSKAWVCLAGMVALRGINVVITSRSPTPESNKGKDIQQEEILHLLTFVFHQNNQHSSPQEPRPHQAGVLVQLLDIEGVL